MASTATEPTSQWWSKAAMITIISETNGDRPGRPQAARPATRKNPARTGADFSTPPISRIDAVPVRWIRNPATRNISAVAMPWLTM